MAYGDNYRNRNNRPQGPVPGEIRVHKRTGVFYVLHYKPGTERAAWVRWDALLWDMLSTFPRPIAKTSELRKFNRRKLGLEDPNAPTYAEVKFS